VAVLSSSFPAARISAILGAFQAAAVFGSALGVVAGGLIAAAHGWRQAFVWVGAVSLLLVALFPLFVREPPRVVAAGTPAAGPTKLGDIVRELLKTSSARYTYLGSGLQIAILAVIAAWMPSFLAREYGVATDQAGTRAGLLIMMAGVGMVVGGLLADRAGAPRRLRYASAYAFSSFVLLSTAFAVAPGATQMALLLAGTTLAGAHAGVVGAVILEVTHPGLRATAIATLALSNNLLGLAPGPYLAGRISDATSLGTALMIMPVAGVFAAACFLLAGRTYERDAASRAAGTATR
jgi:predicted MFS family arabinose efflux permease